MMLAADARAEGAIMMMQPGGGGNGRAGRAAMGREEIVKSLEPYIAQLKGHIEEVGVGEGGRTGVVSAAPGGGKAVDAPFTHTC